MSTTWDFLERHIQYQFDTGRYYTGKTVNMHLANINMLFCDVDVEEQLEASAIALNDLYAID